MEHTLRKLLERMARVKERRQEKANAKETALSGRN
jgi:hypothetical protein